MLIPIANFNSSSVTDDVKESFMSFDSQRCPKTPRLTQGLFQAALWSRGWLKHGACSSSCMCRTSCGSRGGNEGRLAVHHWEHREGSWWDFESQGLWYVPLFLPHQCPLKNVHINPDHICTGMIPNENDLYVVRRGFVPKCPHNHNMPGWCSSQPQDALRCWSKLPMGCMSHDGSCAWSSYEAHGCSTAPSSPTSCSGSAPLLQNLALLSGLLLIPALPAHTHHTQEVHFQPGCSACELRLLHNWKRDYQEQLSFSVYTCRNIYPLIWTEETAPPPLWDWKTFRCFYYVSSAVSLACPGFIAAHNVFTTRKLLACSFPIT